MQKHESDLGIRKEHLQHVGETKNNETIGNNGVSTVVDSNTLRAAASELGFESTVCRLVALSDARIPCSKQILPPSLNEPPHILEKLDAIYHAISRIETRHLAYMDRNSIVSFCKTEEKKLVNVLRNSLEDAGFELLSQRDLDLCDALNVGYLLRLSIDPDLTDLDPGILDEFYPERSYKNDTEDALFGGRVLVYRRGYSSEVTTGRLLLPKIDYLQASLVSRSVAAAITQVGVFEKNILNGINTVMKVARSTLINVMGAVITPVSTLVVGWKNSTENENHEVIGIHSVTKGARMAVIKAMVPPVASLVNWQNSTEEESHDDFVSLRTENMYFKLARYGGRQVKLVGSLDLHNELTPFLICELKNKTLDDPTVLNASIHQIDEEQRVNHDIYEALNRGDFTCQYDSEHRRSTQLLPTTLLERVSISSIVDVLTKEGRAKFAKRFFSKSELVEPTFEEVVVVWRPTAKKKRSPKKLVPPRFFYDLAEVLDVDKVLPERPILVPEPDPLPLEIRAFNGVPMANLPAVLPKTKLVFRPADALLNDFISVATLILISFSFKFDNPRLDLIAFISLGLWIFRTIIRYSNKLARYDLLVKKFLTSKIANRNAGALKYITGEAGSQRAVRAALVHSWLLSRTKQYNGTSGGVGGPLTRDQVTKQGYVGVNNALAVDKFIDINVGAALNDLEDLKLIKFKGSLLESVADQDTAVSSLTSVWSSIFDEERINLDL